MVALMTLGVPKAASRLAMYKLEASSLPGRTRCSRGSRVRRRRWLRRPLSRTRAGGFVIDCAGHTSLMTSRDERMARNEAASREINEEIEEAYQGEPPANRLDIVCECALKMCDRSIDITMAEYRMVRSDLRQFAIVPEHLATAIERIVYETDRFAVVAKREGTPADVARDENQRG